MDENRVINISMIALVLFAIVAMIYVGGLNKHYTEPGEMVAENAAVGMAPAASEP